MSRYSHSDNIYSRVEQQLINFRETTINPKHGGLSKDGLLRESMRKWFIKDRITTIEEFKCRPPWLRRVYPAQLCYLPMVFLIVSQLPGTGD
jgi:hypothetical protein